MELVCLDTHILIWGIKEESEPGQEDMIFKAKAFLKYLDDNKIKSLIPAVVIGELLMRICPQLHAKVNSIFENKFIIAAYDTSAASCFATIWQSKKDDSTIEKLKNDYSVTREELKADCQIVATAVTHGASCIYSYDPGMAKFAEGYIAVKKIPAEALRKQTSFDFSNTQDKN